VWNELTETNKKEISDLRIQKQKELAAMRTQKQQ
jgi:hypothetical protein